MKNIFNGKKIETRRGQSLMELLIGMAVGAVLIIGSATIITSSLQENGQVTNIQIQAQLGEELLNNTKAWAQGNWNALLALSTSTTSSYYLNTSSSPFTILSTSSTGPQSIINNGVTFQRSFSISDVYRASNGNVTTTVSGNFDDPSTKLITATVSVASSTISPTTYSMYITRNAVDYLDQTTWAGGSGATVPKTFVSSTYAAATNTAINASGSFQIAIIPSGGGSSTYTYYRSITVTSTTSVASGTNTNFPMLFSGTYSWLEASSSGGNIQNLTTAPNGGQEPADFVFTSDSGCSSQLNFETESYTSSTGVIVDWVDVPSLSAGSVIYACYDSASVAADQSHPSSTWNSNFSAAYHLANPTSSVSLINSASSTTNLVTQNNISTTAGQIDGAGSFNGTNSYATSSQGLGLAISGTESAWIYITNGSPFNGMILDPFDNNSYGGKGLATNYSYTYNSQYPDLTFEFQDYSNHSLNGGAISNNAWHYVAATWNDIGGSTTMKMYIDGAFNTSTNVAYDIFQFAGVTTELGADGNGPGSLASYFGGKIDEPEVGNSAFTPSWIATAYNNQNSPSTFYGVGSAATSTGGGGGGSSATSTLDSEPFDTGSVSGTQLNSFIWQGSQPAGTTVNFQFAVSNSSSGPWTFVGPDGTGNTYFTGTPGTPINLVSTTNGYTLFNGYRYFSYRATISTTGASGAAVNEITVNWSP